MILELVKKGAPSNRFLWPMELALAQGVPGFGYIMPLFGKEHKNFAYCKFFRDDLALCHSYASRNPDNLLV
ncbi:MAG TPA: hypothetical protein VJL89_00910 [Thermodesulfovibrionia bacterium]|nr:hypothetical protein [Thermodesulfovibrionia bacterium]